MTFERALEIAEMRGSRPELGDNVYYGLFMMTNIQFQGREEVWDTLLESHDTYGLPWDLIHLKARESSDLIPNEWDSEHLKKFMTLYRKARAQQRYLRGPH